MMIIDGSTLPWRLSRDRLVDTLSDLPIKITGTKDLVLRASVGGGGRVRIIPQTGRIIEYSLHNIRDTKVYPENGATYVLFNYRGVSYELGTASPFGCFAKDKKNKEKIDITYLTLD